MTGKRFEYKNHEVYDNLTGETHSSHMVSVNVLNELNDKCEFLEIENESLEDGATKYAELCHKSLKENEQLRTKNNAYIQDIEVFKEENTQLKLENEQLKQRNKRLEEKIQRERTSFTKTHERWSKEAETKIKELSEENEQLKQEVELLREGLKAYDNNLPYYLTCEEVRDFNSDLFEFKIKQQQFYNEHPNLCKIIIDGKEQI